MNRRTLFTVILAALLWPFKSKPAPRRLSLFDWLAENRPDGHCARYKRWVESQPRGFQSERYAVLLANAEWHQTIV